MIEVTGLPEESEPAPKISWAPLLVSALLHSSLVVLALLSAPGPDSPDAGAEPKQSVASVSLPPYQLPSPQQPKQPQEQPPPKETPLGPDSKNPDATVPKEAGPEKPIPIEDLPDPSKRLAEAAPPKVSPEPNPTPVEATKEPAATVKMIQGPSATTNGLLSMPTERFGTPVPNPEESRAGAQPSPSSSAAASAPRSAMGRTGFSPTDGALWQPSFKEAAGRCVKIPDLGKDAQGKPVLASVQGRVFGQDSRTPLSGAHLQIVGTPFSTFSDNNGEYNLRFDPNLLEKCRVQYVEVRAGGFVHELLTLSIGERVRSDDVVLHRR